jgi:hypothetical protein
MEGVVVVGVERCGLLFLFLFFPVLCTLKPTLSLI